MAFDCLDIVAINIPCEDQPEIVYFLDDLGLSLAKSAHQADERYVTGRELIEKKVEYAKNDVIHLMTRDITPECNIDNLETIVCYYADRIARAIWYRSAGLIYKDLVLDSTRYNEFVAYGKESAITNALIYDSSFAILAQANGIDTVTPGEYQKQLETLEPVIREIKKYCCTDCVGSRYQVVIP